MSGSPKNINELIAALGGLKGRILADDRGLYAECRDVFERLKLLSDFDPADIKKTIGVLEKLPPDIRELDFEKLGDQTEELESKSLNKEDLKQLIDDYEKAQGEKKTEIGEEITRRTGKKDVNQFVKTQREIAAKNAENLDHLDPELKTKVAADLTIISENKPKEVVEAIERASLADKFDRKSLEVEIKKKIEKPEEVEKILKRVEEVRAEIRVETRAEILAEKTYEKLKTENVPVSPELKTQLKTEILTSWKTGEQLDLTKSELSDRSEDSTVIEVVKEVEKFKQENLREVVNYRAVEFGRELSQELRDSGVKDEELIEEYVSTVNELTNNPDTARTEVSKEEIVGFVESRPHPPDFEFKTSPGVAAEEAQFMAKNVVMAPKKFNKAIKRFEDLHEKVRGIVGEDKIPKIEKIKEIRVLEKMSHLFKNEKVLKLMNGAQKMVGFLDKVNAFPGSVLAKIGIQRAGLQLLGKIGGQAAVAFVKNAAVVIAEQGTAQGIKSIAMALLTKGTVIAGEAGGATAGALTGLVAAFQALPVVGQVIAVVAIAIAAVVTIIKPIIDGVKNFLEKNLKIDMNGVKHFLTDTLGLGGFIGGVGQFAVDVVGFLVGIPMLIGLISFTAIITPVVIFFLLGVFAYSLFQHGLVSSIVPPINMGNCVLKGESGNINCDPNAPENTWAAVNKANFVDIANRWQAGTNFAEICYNDVVNRALCAGINPTYALWTWLHESGASNYSRDDIEDFGIHFIPENKDFNAQITAFVKLDPASACISDPRIGGDYWLAFSANFLNGDCDPDRGNSIFPDVTPRTYAAELRETWSWISNAPMPNSIHVPKGGQNCGSIGTPEPLPGNAHEVIKDGKVWICTENTQEPVGDYDPNSPGLGGVIVDGECSVGDVVVPTKQCDPQWGSTQLRGGNCDNGKPGTICSAGCGPTSVSMMFRHVNGSLTPDNVIFGSGSAYSGMGCAGSSLDQARTELTKKFGSGAVTYDATTQGCDEKAIAKWICSGKVVMILANFYRNSSLDLGGHFVLAVGVKNGKIVVRDPYYSTTETPFDGTRAYGYAHDIRGCLTVNKSAIK
ncbi:MAG: C39 family peptidase [Candidatus Shapirobacteria bacterium]